MKPAIFAIAALALLALAALAISRMPGVGHALIDAATWAHDVGAPGVLALAAAYVVATLALAPSVALNVPTGFAFGFVWGSLLAVPVGIGAAIVAFLLGRSVLRGPLERRFHDDPRIAAIDRVVRERGLVIVLLLRLTPAIPFAPASYLLAMTRVRVRDFALGTALGMTPFTVLFVYLGATSSDVLGLIRGRGAQPWQLALLAVSIASAIALSAVASRLARRELGRVG